MDIGQLEVRKQGPRPNINDLDDDSLVLIFNRVEDIIDRIRCERGNNQNYYSHFYFIFFELISM